MSNIPAFVRPMCRLDGWRGGASGCMGNGWGQMLDHNPDNESSAQLSYRPSIYLGSSSYIVYSKWKIGKNGKSNFVVIIFNI